MTREIEFLLACVRRFITPDYPLPDASGLDWAVLRRSAYLHSVTPLVCWAAQNEGAGVPPAILDELRRDLLHNAQFNLGLSTELTKLLALFEQHRIAVVPLKGPMLTARLYGNLALRTSSDLDLLVREEDVLQAKRVLEANGYRLASTLHWHSDQACFRARENQISFAGQDDLISVDIHWRLLPGYFSSPFDNNEVWRDLREAELRGAPVSVLSPEHQLLFLCAHGTKHLWERLGWVCDVARFLQIEREMDWPSVFEQARQTRTSRMLSLGLLVAEDLLGIALPPAAAECVASGHEARALARTVRERLFAGAPTPTPAPDAARFSLRCFERPSQRLRYILGTFVSPSEAEYRALQLPPALYWLYYPFRPLRLMAKYATRAIGYHRPRWRERDP
jgi:Uncharacterised nucleotidyltransferase